MFIHLGGTKQYFHPKGEYSLTFLVSQCITVGMNLNYMEIKIKGVCSVGLHPGVHVVAISTVIGHWDHGAKLPT